MIASARQGGVLRKVSRQRPPIKPTVQRLTADAVSLTWEDVDGAGAAVCRPSARLHTSSCEMEATSLERAVARLHHQRRYDDVVAAFTKGLQSGETFSVHRSDVSTARHEAHHMALHAMQRAGVSNIRASHGLLRLLRVDGAAAIDEHGQDDGVGTPLMPETEETLSERYDTAVRRNLAVLRIVPRSMGYSPVAIFNLQRRYAASELQRSCGCRPLREAVRLETLLALLRAVVFPPPSPQQQQHITDSRMTPPAGLVSHFSALEQSLPRPVTSDENGGGWCWSPRSFLAASCCDIDTMLLSRVTESMFKQAHPTSSRQHTDAWSDVPDHISSTTVALDLFPLCTVRHLGGSETQSRIDRLLHRTMRPASHQGVVCPDAAYMLSHWHRLVSLSQFREVVLTFPVWLELLHIAAPNLDNVDWRRHQARVIVRQLLHSLTPAQHGTGDTASFGGVTICGLMDDLAMEAFRADNEDEPCAGGWSCGDGPAVHFVRTVALLAQRREWLTAHMRNGRTADTTVSAAPPPTQTRVDQMLAELGVVRKGGAATRSKRCKQFSRVTILSDDPDVMAMAASLGQSFAT